MVKMCVILIVARNHPYIEAQQLTLKPGKESRSSLEIISTVLIDGATLLCGRAHKRSSVLHQVAMNMCYWAGEMG